MTPNERTKGFKKFRWAWVVALLVVTMFAAVLIYPGNGGDGGISMNVKADFGEPDYDNTYIRSIVLIDSEGDQMASAWRVGTDWDDPIFDDTISVSQGTVLDTIYVWAYVNTSLLAVGGTVPTHLNITVSITDPSDNVEVFYRDSILKSYDFGVVDEYAHSFMDLDYAFAEAGDYQLQFVYMIETP